MLYPLKVKEIFLYILYNDDENLIPKGYVRNQGMLLEDLFSRTFVN